MTSLNQLRQMILAALARLRPPKPVPAPAPKPAPAPVADDGKDEYARLNYYKDVDFADYQLALRNRVPDGNGTLPFITMIETPCPTPAQWAALTDAQKAAKGSVRFP